MSVSCNSCGKVCEDYQELAIHISTSKTGHKKGKRWAASYINRHVINKRTIDFSNRTPLTVQDIKNREESKRELSGVQVAANTVCPKCKHPSCAVLEVEHVESPQAWRISGRLAKMCESCG